MHIPVDTLSLVFLVQNNPPTIVRERILGLIQYWADAFRGKPQLAEVEELYEQLKGEGVEFPPIDLDVLAPIATPQRVSVCVCGCECVCGCVRVSVCEREEWYMSREKRLLPALALVSDCSCSATAAAAAAAITTAAESWRTAGEKESETDKFDTVSSLTIEGEMKEIASRLGNLTLLFHAHIPGCSLVLPSLSDTPTASDVVPLDH